MRKWLISLLGGYPDARSALLSITDEGEKHEILSQAVSHLFNVITKDDILRVNEYGQWTYQGKILSAERSKLISAEADMFLRSELWKILNLDISYIANKKMFIDALRHHDVVWGKISVYNLDILRTRLEQLKAGKGSFSGNK